MLGLGLNKGLLKRIVKQQAPPAHTVLSYLQNNGAAWYNTGIKGRSGLKVEMKVSFPSTLYTAFFFGSRQGAGTAAFVLALTGSTVRSEYNTLATALSTTLSANTEYTIKKVNNRQYINDVEFGSYAEGTFNNNCDMYMFGTNTNGTARSDGVVIRNYSLKVWDENDTLLGDFIAVIKDGVYCAYDNVTHTYHYNQGAGSFTGA